MSFMELFLAGLIGTYSGPNQTLVHQVVPTKMIKSGQVTLKTGPDRGGETKVDIKYELKTTWYAPVGDQKGTETQSFPTKFLSEEGYRELEQNGSMRYDSVIITHLGRTNAGAYRNMHKIQIDRPGKWRAVALYHPDIPAAGWGYLTLTLQDVPVLGSYTINSQIR